MTYRIAALQVQPVLVVEDDDGNLAPLPPGQQVPPFSVGIADLKGSPVYDRLVLSVNDLNEPAKAADDRADARQQDQPSDA